MAGEPVEPEFLPSAEVCRRLSIAEGTLHGIINRGELPAYRIGARVKIRTADFDEYLEPGNLGETAALRARRSVRRQTAQTAIEPIVIQPTKRHIRRPTRI